MDISELKPGDTVTVVAVITKVVDDAEGEPPVVLVAITPANRLDGNIVALVAHTDIAAKLSSQAAPDTPAWPLGTLDRSHESQRAAMDQPAP